MIYLDNAATSFPKPDCVASEVKRCMTDYCGNPGRSGHVLSLRAAEKIFACREAVANFFGSSEPEKVVFTLNTTYALNFAIHTFCERDSHVLISNMEHNSVFRPVVKKKKEGSISYSVFNVLQPTPLILREIENKLQPNTKLLIMLHASNICGRVFPIREIGALCRKKHITFIVDAAQSAGKIPIDIHKDNIDALCAPAHKGLLGPQGLGFVLFGEKEPQHSFIVGGNGTNSLSAEMGLQLPESFEGGTLPTPAIAGLHASLQWLQKIGTEAIRQKEMQLVRALRERLLALPGSVLYAAEYLDSGILLYENTMASIEALSSALNRQGICVRSGFHCAPLAHSSLKTGKNGALRISPGYFNTLQDIDAFYQTVCTACK